MENSGKNDNNIINNKAEIKESNSSVDNRTDLSMQESNSDNAVVENVAAKKIEAENKNDTVKEENIPQETKDNEIVAKDQAQNKESQTKEEVKEEVKENKEIKDKTDKEETSENKDKTDKEETQESQTKEEENKDKEQKTEDKEQKTEDKEQKTEDKEQKAEDKEQKTEDKEQKAEKTEEAEETEKAERAENNTKEQQDKKAKGNKEAKPKGKKQKQKEFDEYGREILDLTFENILTMSKNTQKLHYSKIKNEINLYKYIKCKFKGDSEIFYKGENKLFCIKLNEDQILLYCALPEGSIDKKVYPHRVIKNEEFSDTPIQVTINSTNAALKRALELVNLVMDISGILKSKSALPVAYAEKYPIKPNAVLRGEENISPEEKQYTGPEYKDIQGEITKYLAEKITGKATTKSAKKGKEKLEEQRQTAKSLKAAIALAEPIVYYYDVAVERDNNPLYINIQQVLNDRFLGKLVPQHFFAIAEGSERIEKLNFLALEAAVIDCNAKPEKDFVVSISCRLLIKKATLKKLISVAKTENENLIMAFDCSLLEALGDTAIRGITALKEAGIKILLENIEQAGLRALTDFFIDYLRLDSRYYSDDNPKTVNQLDMLTGYTKLQGIITIATQVENIKQTIFMLKHGVDAIQGRSVSIPRRLVHVALKETKSLPISGG